VAGCGLQIPHRDFSTGKDTNAEVTSLPDIEDLAPLQAGYSVILYTSDDVLLRLPTFATDGIEDLIRPHIYRLNRGDVVVFRYDWCHAYGFCRACCLNNLHRRRRCRSSCD